MKSQTYTNNQSTIGSISQHVNSETSITSTSIPKPITHRSKKQSRRKNSELFHIKYPTQTISTIPHIYITEPHIHPTIKSVSPPLNPLNTITNKKSLQLKTYNKHDPNEPYINTLCRGSGVLIKSPTTTSSTQICKTSRNVLPSILKPLNIKYTKETYLSKTKEISQLHYSLNLKKEQKNQIESNIQKEIEGLNQTMKSMELYNKMFEENVISKINNSLKELNITLEKERIVVLDLYQQVVHQRKEINVLETKIRRKELEKKTIEKWIEFQLEVKQFGKVNDLQEELHKLGNGVIFESTEAIEDQFKSIEQHNVMLLMKYNELQNELDDLKNEKNELILSRTQYEHLLHSQVIDKEKILELIKQRHKMLVNQYQHVVTSLVVVAKKKKAKTYDNNVTHSVNQHEALYTLIMKLYSNCVGYLKQFVTNNVVVNFNNIPSKESKMLAMLLSIEICVDYIKSKFKFYYKNYNVYGNELKRIISEIDFKKKQEKAMKMKNMENQRYKELKMKIEEKENKHRFVMLRKVDLYPAGRFIGKNQCISKENVSKELEFHDFVYDSDKE
jgi:hypothetical protein